MSTLIFQIHIKQWDKSQRSPVDVATRASIPTAYLITGKPKYFILDKPCIVEQHGDDKPTSAYPTGRIKNALLADGSVRIDRFHISNNDGVIDLSYAADNQQPVIIGRLNQGWIQARYSWRYAVEEGGQFYWLYEEVTFNAACVKKYDADYFLSSHPETIFNVPD